MSGPSRSHPVLAIYPGSRAWHLRASLGAFLYVGEKIRQRVPGLELAVVQSPFVGEKDMQMALDHPWSLKLPTTRGSVQQGTILTQSGLQVTCLRGRPHEVFPHFDLAVTIPGTNSAELALAGKPFILAIHELAYLGGGGLLKLLEKAPVPDSWKTYFRHRKLRRLRFLSIPNQIAGQMVAIEIIMTSGSEVLEDCLVRYLNDSELRQQYGDSLRQVMGPAGAAQAIASDLCCRPPHKTSNGWNVFLFRHRAVVLLVLALIALFIARPSSLSYRTGLALAVVAELLRVWAVGHAGRITRESVLSADQLVVGGPYAWVRNPLYLGNCLNASAVVFACAGNWGCQIAGAAALLVGLGLALFYRRLIMVEESFLLEKFGDSYRAYCQNVPRLWPRIPARTQSDWKSSQFCFGQGAIWEGTSILWWLLVWGVLAAKLA